VPACGDSGESGVKDAGAGVAFRASGATPPSRRRHRPRVAERTAQVDLPPVDQVAGHQGAATHGQRARALRGDVPAPLTFHVRVVPRARMRSHGLLPGPPRVRCRGRGCGALVCLAGCGCPVWRLPSLNGAGSCCPVADAGAV
jgi:hypothetical protein